MNYKNLSIVELHQLLVDKIIQPSDLVKMILEACEGELSSNAINFIYKEIIEQSKNLNGKINQNDYLCAIPYFAKDNISTKNIPTSSSSNILKGYTPSFDATLITSLNEHNALMIGKSALDELGMGGVGLYSCNGPIYNPHDNSRLVGGSSSGSAYLVAKGIVPFAIGTDTGDSIRKPASFNNIVGFKPSYAAISRYGLLPYSPSLDTIGFLTRNVDDVAILCDASFKYDEKDATSIEIKDKDFFKKINYFSNQKIFGYIKTVIDDLPKDLSKMYYDFFVKLENQGFKVKAIEFNQDLLEAVSPIYMMISYSESASTNANLDGIKYGTRVNGDDYEQVIKNSRTKGFGDVVKRRFLIGSLNLNKQNQTEYLNKAKQVRRLMVEAVNEVYKKIDVLIIPPFYDVAPLVSEVNQSKITNYLDDILILANMNGSPSITIPFVKKNNLGIGINLMTKPKDDLLCLQAAKVCENIIGIKNQIVGGKYE